MNRDAPEHDQETEAEEEARLERAEEALEAIVGEAPEECDPHTPRRPLTERQARFVLAYLGEARGESTRAARLAGYSGARANQSGYRMLEHPEVRRAIREEGQLRARRLALSADKVMLAAAEMAFFDVGQLVHPGSGTALGPGELPELARRIVQGLEVEQEVNADVDKEGKLASRTLETVKYKLPSRTTALELVAKLGGYLIERKEVSQTGTLRVAIVPAKTLAEDADEDDLPIFEDEEDGRIENEVDTEDWEDG